ncbi:bactofilin family protein [Desulfovibrio oxyclinae]|jgi:cytoskeletal protein CcmA (bactofilin family)|uniref:bactofilin family protein n=1 Tax=Desulfovibrio oxyclinae TaxID=63560 RepID=UPI00037AE446|nr:polymer-forming cytoskeletal protein [Desulfovibrio oxyclinae]
MGFFSKSSAQGDSSELNAFLGVGTEYRGKLHFVGTVRIDGIFQGEISTEGTLVLGPEAYIQGVVNVGDLASSGKIEGDVFVGGRTILQKGSRLSGSLSTPTLVMEKGAFLEGEIAMTSGKQAEVKATSTVQALGAPEEDELADQGDLG